MAAYKLLATFLGTRCVCVSVLFCPLGYCNGRAQLEQTFPAWEQYCFHGPGAADALQEMCEYCFPIKCMHDSVMLATMLKHAFDDGFSWLKGLEVSTKAELLLVICLWDHLLSTSPLEQPRETAAARMTVICNGWKDEEYLELVDTALVAGLDVVVILENEWDTSFVVSNYSRLRNSTTSCSKHHLTRSHSQPASIRVLPKLGLRVQLNKQHPGRCVHYHRGVLYEG